MATEIPPQEQMRKWFKSHLLAREIELQDLYELPQGELDLVMAETACARRRPLAASQISGVLVLLAIQLQ